jgi:hypothetical protein
MTTMDHFDGGSCRSDTLSHTACPSSTSNRSFGSARKCDDSIAESGPVVTIQNRAELALGSVVATAMVRAVAAVNWGAVAVVVRAGVAAALRAAGQAAVAAAAAAVAQTAAAVASR